MLSEWFFYFYPSVEKKYKTDEGEDMRIALKYVTILHAILFFVCLGLIGFWPMIINFILCGVTFSLYLTLKELQILFYFLLLVGAFAYGLVIMFDKKAEGVWQELFNGILTFSYLFILFYVYTYYKYYRRSGGLKGKAERRGKGLNSPLLSDETETE